MKSFVSIAVIATCVLVAHACDRDRIDICSKTILPHILNLAAKAKDLDSRDRANQMMQELCVIIQKFASCIQPHIQECPREMVRSVRMVFDVYSKSPFNCPVHTEMFGEGSDAKIEDMKGLENCDIKKMEKCTYDAMPNIQKLAQEILMSRPASRDEMVSQMCDFVSEYGRCIYPAYLKCKNDNLVDSFKRTFNTFNNKPFYCDIDFSGVKATSATFLTIVMATGVILYFN